MKNGTFLLSTGSAMAAKTIREITINADERVILNVRSTHYVKLVFASCVIALKEEDGVVFSYTEQHPPVDSFGPDDEVDPIAEAAKCEGYYSDAQSVVNLHNPNAEIKAPGSHCTDLNKYLDDLLVSSGDEYEKESIPDTSSDESDSVGSLLDYSTDSSAALSYHYGDTQEMNEQHLAEGGTQLEYTQLEYTQADDYEDTQLMM